MSTTERGFLFDQLLSEIRDGIAEGNQYLAKLVGAPLPSAPGAPVSPMPVVTIPVDPEVVNRILTFARFLGKAKTVIFTLSASAPSGQATTFLLTIPQNEVDLLVQPGRVVTNYTNPSLLVDLWIDGTKLTVPYEAALVEPALEVDFGQFYFAQNQIQIVITNDSGTTAEVSTSLGVLRIDQDFFFNKFYVPLVNKQVAVAEQYAAEATT